MSNVIKAIATAMIIILIATLIWIFVSYYKENDSVGALSTDFSSGNTNVSTLEISSGNDIGLQDKEFQDNKGLIESIINNGEVKQEPNIVDKNEPNSGDSIKNEDINKQPYENENSNSGSSESISQNNNSGDDNSGENIPDTIVEIPGEEENNQILITSDSQTSNQQKQEILTEIDKALQGLLEAVGKVEVVDEERLDATLNSEVGES